jgi:hypothetical protein
MSTDLARLDLLLRRRGTIGYALGMALTDAFYRVYARSVNNSDRGTAG